MTPIKCRAKVSPNCYNGREEAAVYGEEAQETDGTWDGDTVVCDACYINLGQPLLRELEAAIRGRHQ